MATEHLEIASVNKICNFLLNEHEFDFMLCGPISMAKWMRKMDTGMTEMQVQQRIKPCVKEFRRRAHKSIEEHQISSRDDCLDPPDKLDHAWVRYSIIHRLGKKQKSPASLPASKPLQGDAIMEDAPDEVEVEDDEVISDPPIVGDSPFPDRGLYTTFCKAYLKLGRAEVERVLGSAMAADRQTTLKRKRAVADNDHDPEHEETAEQRKTRNKARKDAKKAEKAAEDKVIRKAAKKARRDQETFEEKVIRKASKASKRASRSTQ
ncbi:hypothetical protein E4T39_08608 [Aureobasidium subglaciale]|nr:hypothetical protein E4T39_08608 [Aureobasidium subglaciale]